MKKAIQAAKTMTVKKAIETLEQHQRWRTGEEIPMIHPKELSKAIAVAVKKLKNLLVSK